MEFGNTPFIVGDSQHLQCQYGPQYYKSKPKKGKQLRLQSTRKIGCPAHVVVKHYTLFPEYAIHPDDIEGKSKYNLRLLKEQTLKKLQNEIESGCIKQTTRYWLSLPTVEAHEKAHPVKQAAVFSQKVNPAVAQMIAELVADGITEIDDVKKSLRHRINHYLCKDSPPDPNDRAYFPTHDDLRNHIYRAKQALQHSKYDQENLRLKVLNWKKTHPDANFFFRPRCIDSDCNSTAAESKKEGEVDGPTAKQSQENSFLWIHQQKWQKDLILKYGNTISLIDATHKTTRYELPLFFVCVRTNVGYSVVAEFILESESTESISEALHILHCWNPEWNPKFWMCDYSDAEISALECCFPDTIVYLCDFHREQAWERWVKDGKHGLTSEEADQLLAELRACAWAPPGKEGENIGICYEESVRHLKHSKVWKDHPCVQQWLSTTWLSISQVPT